MTEVVVVERPSPRYRSSLKRVRASVLAVTVLGALGLGVTGAPAHAATGNCEFTSGNVLHLGEQVTSCQGGAYALILQTDGNLVFTPTAAYQAIWNAGTQNQGVDRVVMQGDGNLVAYAGNKPIWNSGTVGFDGASLRIQEDGNMVIYQQGYAIWTRHGGFTNELQIFTVDPQAAQYQVVGVNRPDESTSDPADETTDLIPPGARAGDVILLRNPTGQIKYYSVVADPNFGKIFSSTVGGALTGATGAAVAVPIDEATGQRNRVGLITTTVIGGTVGAAVGLVNGVYNVVTDPRLTVIPGVSSGATGRIIPFKGYYVKGYGILPLQPSGGAGGR